ncbi:hypothetical protein FSY45_19285 [Comamonas sp. Z1]|uniref:hypothetical protein n=1 Tax=Comamonas sp. Z1 TaxID=2601246 RepID=UPI0011E6B879|nr:hypothetical protein [Comamonas sp. Z1]TYK74310.1 hypothetical protein FSY45_19285 [Comamonas sp. Z1]
MSWISRIAQPQLQQSQAELAQARADIERLNVELDEMQVTVEGKDRQLRASAEALALASSEAARSRRLASQLQTIINNERRFTKQMGTELAAARKKAKRR